MSGCCSSLAKPEPASETENNKAAVKDKMIKVLKAPQKSRQVISRTFWQNKAGQEVQMKKSRFNESQIVGILKEADAGVKVQDIWRKYNISSATYYKWKSKYGGMEVSDVKRLKELEGENRRLKQMYADVSLENRALRDLIEKKL
jgi:putative transposase